MSQGFLEIKKMLKAANSQTEILAVSKLQPVEKIRALYNLGQKKFAENYVQEAIAKQIELKDLDIEWHFIGSLQTNKVKFVVGQFALIHSVDSLKLAQAIDKHAGKSQIIQKILLQVNLAAEETKGGFSIKEIETLLPALLDLKNIEVAGLMTMPPLFEDAKKARPYFRELKQLRDKLKTTGHPLNILSMGTSSDYLVAASESASIVRLGTILFGDRPKAN